MVCINQDQLKRLIARYEETAKEREKVLINVNIVSLHRVQYIQPLTLRFKEKLLYVCILL